MPKHTLYFVEIGVAEEAEMIVDGLLGVCAEHVEGLSAFDFGLCFQTTEELSPAQRGQLMEQSEAYGAVFNV